MNTLLRASLAFLLSGATLALAAEQSVHVDASRDLRLAVVDAAKPSKARDAQHTAFAESLGEAVGKQCGGTVGVRAKCVSADSAAFNLGTGVYDAVLVIGNTLPRPLMISDVSRLTAVLGTGKNEKKVYLVFGAGDATLANLLSASFSAALNNQRFLDSLNDPADRPASGGAKLASAAP
jgi:xanthine/CO dehydrogenase XdhC/CoxF family maturation factor